MELLQTYDAGRLSSLGDFYTNSLGTFLGAVLGWALPRFVGWSGARLAQPSPFVGFLLASWLGFQVFAAALPRPSGEWPWLSFFERLTIWLAVALFLETLLGGARSRWVLGALAALVIVTRAWPAEQSWSAACAALLWGTILWRSRLRAPVIAALFAAHVVVFSLLPFHFLAAPRAFGWVPFVSFLEDSREGAMRSLFDKAFTYGTLVWVCIRAGWTWRAAALGGSVFVFALRLLQVYLPGRSAEITDCLVLLGMAGLSYFLQDQPVVPVQASGAATKR
jgi:hypothetical protein